MFWLPALGCTWRLVGSRFFFAANTCLIVMNSPARARKQGWIDKYIAQPLLVLFVLLAVGFVVGSAVVLYFIYPIFVSPGGRLYM